MLLQLWRDGVEHTWSYIIIWQWRIMLLYIVTKFTQLRLNIHNNVNCSNNLFGDLYNIFQCLKCI